MLPTWFWVLLWVVLALAAVGLLAWLALRIWRQARALLDELAQVSDRAALAVDLLSEIDMTVEDQSWPDADEADRGFTAAHRVKSDLPT